MDEEVLNNQTENQDVPAQNDTDSSPVESADVEQTQVPEADSEAEVTPDQETEVKEEQKPKRNAQSRIKQLIEENKQLKQQQNPFSDAMNQPIPDNLTEEQYRALVAGNTSTALEVQQLKRQMAFKEFESENETVLNQYPELNPESDSFDEELASTLADAYWEDYVVKDQNGNFVGTKRSLKEFTEKMIKPYRNAINRGAAQTTEALNQQASESPVTPESSKSSEPKPFESLSIEEMEAKLGIVRQ